MPDKALDQGRDVVRTRQSRSRRRASRHRVEPADRPLIDALEPRILLDGSRGAIVPEVEVNDTLATIQDLGVVDTLTVDGSAADPDDNDYYRMTAAFSRTATVDLNFVHGQGNLDLEVYDHDLVLLDGSQSLSNNESVSFDAIGGETYIIRVFSFALVANPDYDLVLGGTIPPDRFEPNQPSSQATDLGLVGDRTENDLSIHVAGDHDFYKITTAGAGTLDIKIEFIDAIGDLDLRVRDAGGRVVKQSLSEDDDESVSFDVGADEAYFINVFGFGSVNINPDYDLLINGPPTNRDRFEPNDGFGEPTDLGLLGTWAETGLNIHDAADVDVFSFTALGTGTAQVDLQFVHANGDLELELLDAGQNALGLSQSSTDNEQVTGPVTAGQQYSVRVSGTGGATNDYDLAIQGAPIGADRFEDNDVVTSATDLGSVTGLTENGLSIDDAGPGPDVDYFRFDAGQTGATDVRILFDHALGDLTLAVFDAALNTLATSQTTTDDEHVVIPVTAGQRYYIRVEGFDDAVQHDYDLVIAGTTPPALPVVAVSVDGGAIADGATVDFGTDHPGNPVFKTFTVTNNGTAPLQFDDTPRILGNGFSTFEPDDLIVPAGQFTTFEVRLDAFLVGSYTGDVLINTKPQGSGPITDVFNFTVTGVVTGPELEITQGVDRITQGLPAVDFGETTVGNPELLEFVVSNNGDQTLTLSNPVVPNHFQLTAPLGSTSLAPGAQTTFTVQMTAIFPGNFSHSISIASNDANENPFEFPIIGRVTGDAPTTAVRVEKAINAVDPSNPTAAEDADAVGGMLLEVGDDVVWTYLVSNPGDLALTITDLSDNGGTTSDQKDDFAPLPVLNGPRNVGDTNNDNLLDVGEVWRYTSQGAVIHQAEVGPYSNRATVTAQVPVVGTIVTDSDLNHHTGIDARITLTGDGTNEVGDNHAFTAVVQIDAGAGFLPVGSGVPVTIDLATSHGAVVSGGATSGPTNSGGAFSVSFTSDTAGQVTGHGSTTFDLNGLTLTRETDGFAGNSGDVVKTFVDAKIEVDPDGNRQVGENHTFTATVWIDDGTGTDADGAMGTFDRVGAGTGVTIDLADSGGAVANPAGPASGQTDAAGELSATFTSTTPGQVAGHASTSVLVGGVTLDRETDGQGDNSDDAVVTFSGSPSAVRIEKAINAVNPASPTAAEDADNPNGTLLEIGTPVSWTYLVSNPGSIALDVTGIDDDAGTAGNGSDDFVPAPVLAGGFNVGDGNTDGLLDPSEVWQYTSVGVVSYEVALGQFVNVATVTAQVPQTSETLTDTDPNHHIGVDAKITIDADGTNEVGDSHTFTAVVWYDDGTGSDADGEMGTFDRIGAGTDVTVDLASTLGALAVPAGATSGQTDADGAFAATFTSDSAGRVTGHAAATLVVGALSMQRETDGIGNNGDDAIKTFVDAKITISPDDTNEVGDPHTFTAIVWVDDGTGSDADGEMGTFDRAQNEAVSIILTDMNGASADPGGAVNGVTDANGGFSATFTSDAAGVVVGHAFADVRVGGIVLTRETDGQSDNSDDAVKRFVDARITIDPDHSNEIGDSHTFTAVVWVDDGTGSDADGVMGTFDRIGAGTGVTIDLASNHGALAVPAGATSGQTDANGAFSVTFTSDTAGQVTAHASTSVQVGGLTLDRETDGQGDNGDDAVKTFVDAKVLVDADDTNEVGAPHTFTATVWVDDGTGSDADGQMGHFDPVGAGTDVTIDLADANGALAVPAGATSGQTDASGAFSVTFTSDTAGQVTGHAFASVLVDGLTLSRETDGQGGNGDDVVKTFVDVKITIDPDGNLQVSENHTFTAVVWVDDGTGSNADGQMGSFDRVGAGTDVVIDLAGSGGAVPDPVGPAIGQTDASGAFSVTFTSGTAGQVTGHASTSVLTGGLTLDRETDGLGGNSDDAVVTFAGSLASVDIEKAINAVDPASPTFVEDADVPTGPVLEIGSAVTWTYLVSNTGNAALEVTSIVDDAGTAGVGGDDFTPAPVLAGGFNTGDTNTDGLLDTDEVWQYTSAGVVSYEVALGQFVNVSAVTAQVPQTSETVMDEDLNHHLGVDARITIVADDTNEVGAPHTFTAVVWYDDGTGTDADGEMGTLDRFGAGADIAIDLADAHGALAAPAGATSGQTDANGEFSVTFTSDTAGQVTGHASATLDLGTLAITRETDGLGGNSGDAVKTFVDARIMIDADDTNEVGDPHTFTATVWVDDGTGTDADGEMGTFDRAISGAGVSIVLTSTNGATAPSGPFSGTTDASGTFEHTFTSAAAGRVTGHATTTLSVNGFVLQRQTDGLDGNSDDAIKTFVDAKITIDPDDTNRVGDPHTFTAVVWIDDGTGSDADSEMGTFDRVGPGTDVTVDLAASQGAVAVPAGATSGQTDAGGAFSVTFASDTAGQVRGHASTSVQVGGLTLDRETDGLGDNGDDAIKTFVDARIILDGDDTNEVGDPHTFTAAVWVDDGTGTDADGQMGTFDPAGAGAGVSIVLTSTNGATAPAGPFVGTTNASGTFAVTFTSPTAGQVAAHATTTVSIGGFVLQLETDGLAGNSDDAVKTFVDANITIGPDANLDIGQPHAFEAVVWVNDGTGTDADGQMGAFDLASGQNVTIDLVASGGAGAVPSGPLSGLTGADGVFGVTFTSNAPGDVAGHASASISVGGVTLDRETDGAGGNGADAMASFTDPAAVLATLGDFVWEDLDADGVQDPGEPGLEGVGVDLQQSDGTPVSSTTTDVDGRYRFEDLAAGDYRVIFTTPANFIFSPASQAVEAADSDADPNTGQTDIVSLSAGQTNLDVDAGMIRQVPRVLVDVEKAVNAVDPANPTVAEDADAAGGPALAAGTTVIWTYLVSNPGDVPLTITSLVDDAGSPIATDDFTPAPVLAGGFNAGDTNQDDALDPGETWQFTSAGVFDYDAVVGTYRNDVQVTAQSTSPAETVSDTDPNHHRAVDARISIGNDATNEVGQDHTFTAVVWIDDGTGNDADGEMGTFDRVGAGTIVSLSLDSSLGAAASPAGPFSGTTDANGAFAVTFTSSAAGRIEGSASTTVSVGGVPLTRATDGTGGSSASAVKTFVDAKIIIGNDGSKQTGASHTFAATVWADDGSGSDVDGVMGSFDAVGGAAVTIDLASLGGASALPAGPFSGTTNGEGRFEAAFSSSTSGQVTGHASTTLVVGGVSLDRETDGVAPNSGDARVTFTSPTVLPATVGDFVWEDLDRDGIQDAGEPGVEGVTVDLQAPNGTPLGTTTTDVNGLFQFTGLTPDIYRIVFRAPDGFEFAPQGQGSNPALDSDASFVDGSTAAFVLSSGANDVNRDAGLVRPVVDPPSIGVARDGVDLESSVSIIDLGATRIGAPLVTTLTISNPGTVPVTLIDPVAVPDGFSARSLGQLTLDIGETTTFDLQLDALDVGSFNGSVVIGIDDANAGPFTLTAQGTVIEPEIAVLNGNDELISGTSEVTFDPTLLGTPAVLSITVTNLGGAVLELDAPVILEADSGFTVGGLGATELDPTASTSFDITSTAAAPGTFNATISLGSDDRDEDPFTFTVSSDVTAPEIQVFLNGSELLDGEGLVDFGQTDVGDPVTVPIRVENVGTAPLALGAPLVLPTGFAASDYAATIVDPGAEVVISLELAASTAGTFDGTISLSNGDADENPFQFMVTGEVVAPEITVFHDGASLVDGASQVDFGQTDVGVPLVETFTVRNVGTAPLTLDPLLNVPDGFEVSVPALAVLDPGAETTFDVTLSAVDAGVRQGDLELGSDDADESPFDIGLTGEVLPPFTVQVVLDTDRRSPEPKNFSYLDQLNGTEVKLTIAGRPDTMATLTLTPEDDQGRQHLIAVDLNSAEPDRTVFTARSRDAFEFGSVSGDGAKFLNFGKGHMVGNSVNMTGPVDKIRLARIADGAHIDIAAPADADLRLDVKGPVGTEGGPEGVNLMFGGTVRVNVDAWHGGQWMIGEASNVKVKAGDFSPAVDIAAGFRKFQVNGGDFASPDFRTGTADGNGDGDFMNDGDGDGGRIRVRANRDGQGGVLAIPGGIEVDGALRGVEAQRIATDLDASGEVRTIKSKGRDGEGGIEGTFTALRFGQVSAEDDAQFDLIATATAQQLGRKAGVDTVKIRGADWTGGGVQTQPGVRVKSVQLRSRRGVGGRVTDLVAFETDLVDRFQVTDILADTTFRRDLGNGRVGRVIGSRLDIGGDVLSRLTLGSEADEADLAALAAGAINQISLSNAGAADGILLIVGLTSADSVRTG